MKKIYFYIGIVLLVLVGCSRDIESILVEESVVESETKVLADGTQLRFSNLGPQIFNTDISTAAFYENNQGNKYLYAVVAGEPAHLIGYDLSAGDKLITDIALPLGNTSNSMVFSTDGILYFTGGGRLYAHTVGSSTIDDLGVALNKQTSLYDLNKGKNGIIYGGTYPDGKIFEYHPQTGFKDLGAMATGKNYVRSMVYHEASHKIFAGMGTGAQLIEFDLGTGTKNNILPANFEDQEFLYQMSLVEGVAGEDRLFMTLQNSNVTLAYNISTGKFEFEGPAIWVPSIVKAPSSDIVYFTKGANVYAFDNLAAGNYDQRVVTPVSGSGRSSVFFGKVLHMFSNTGQLLRYDIDRSTANPSNLEIPGQPRQLNDVHIGPGHTIWTSGYQYGDNAAYSTKTKKTTPFIGLPQTESAAMYLDNMYFGTYTKARIYKYNSRLPWKMNQNPKLVTTVSGQDRPFAGTEVSTKGRVFFGTVPNYGANGGVLVEIDVKNNDRVTNHKPVPDQSIISLLEHEGTLFGGTSIWGGLGSDPVATEAKLFVWDIEKGVKLHEVVPVSGARFISCLLKGNDGYIWGIAQGNLFKIDPKSYEVVSTVKIWSDNRASHVWRPDQLILSPRDNMYYGAVGSNLFRFNPETTAVERLNLVGGHLTLGADGDFYFIRASDLWKMEVR
ncbi:DUF5074 domain-containing protein [Sphingobacterium paucimobilis]|uniref:Uncharacterized protein n=1 Tax=Sphingobacterium paucimobilis HER1398 TaxID=1346330 RepID=U2H814_9SPHI|nr:DUF5074 domain-containing protein [Sphingobacterium paucimobilis]ERJ57856.1 hypothetical protein M472_03660 [Sphingobacterium paucimobilis HER1398]ERJ60307.1 hypothetical protein M472_16230 [Sphingobacterium paucimobilis HER1398]